jgi:hypothetical protein
LNPSGAFTDPGLSDMKKLARHIGLRFSTTPLYFRQSAGHGSALTTEYEQMLSGMVSEKRAEVTRLTGKQGKDKEIAALLSDIRFLEVELQRYQQGMKLFRTKPLPKVGRWGRPETEEAKEEQ